ncbi:fatty acid desaturase [Streptomyces sp. NPDC001941]|uniref:fatty acid desaturase n=1 Tax=Streptomyces sp. NPDC001941 TaxID=3154659 RepID=UPI00331F6395
MFTALSLITAGILLRQADRLHFARHTPHTAPARQLLALQRARANNLTPTLLLAGQWTQIAGLWLLAAHHPALAVAAAFGVAVQLRHLQEASHHAVHGVLARTRTANHLLAEALAHLPLGLAPVAVRHQRHVRDHHPAATLATDPNLTDLHQAGLRPGVSRIRFALALLHPLTPAGAAATLTGLARDLRAHPARQAALLTVPAAAYLTAGWTGLFAGWLLPRLLLYPLLAWLSLIVEHTWFDPEHRTGPQPHVEAGRCLRLYPRNRALAALAAATWLPYGDLHHYAHSAHPGLRWNYLPALERHLPPPHFTPHGLALGAHTVTARHHHALNAVTACEEPVKV